MKQYSFFNNETGAILGYTYCGSDEYLELNTPSGFSAIEGCHDPLCHRVQDGSVLPWVPPKPDDTADHVYSWDEVARRWVDSPTIAKLEAHAHATIDASAGATRLRFITDVPGQQAVYLMKLEEARLALQSNLNYSEDWPHIMSEAEATGVSVHDLAQSIVDRAYSWNHVLSPAIEAYRIGGKAAVSVAKSENDPEALKLALETALAELNSLGS